MEPRAHGFSLWLMPEGTAGKRLARWIDRLASRLGGERFAPHLTLLSGLRGGESELHAAAARVAAQIAPFTVRFDGIEGRPQHFRCLFLRAVAGKELRSAHARAARALGQAPDHAFLPHLSLVYGRLPPARRAALAREIGDGAPVEFLASRLHLWRTEGSVAEWRERAVFELGGG